MTSPHDEQIEAMARAMTSSTEWSSFWSHEDAKQLAAQALTALREKGYAVVPVEPTWPMQLAGRDVILDNDDSMFFSTIDSEAVYRAMLAAAPGADHVVETNKKVTG